MRRTIGLSLVGGVVAALLLGAVAPPAATAAVSSPTATASTGCISSSVALTVTVANTSNAVVRVTATSAFGAKSLRSVAPGATVSVVFPTGATAVSAGKTAVLTSMTVSGQTTRRMTTPAYAALSCGTPSDPGPRFEYSLSRSANPSDDERDAYTRIDAAMSAATARYDRLTDLSRRVAVSYTPGVPTAEASNNGDVRFGTERGYMTEGTALHELAHTLGIGTTWSWDALCRDGVYRGEEATALLREWDGPDATISCDRAHFWPYGLNYDSEFSEVAFERNVLLVNAMREDGVRDE